MKKEKELILKMLEDKKITTEEAMKLLDQLEDEHYEPNNKNKKTTFGSMISNFVKNTVESAMTAAINSDKVQINFGDKSNSHHFDLSHSYILKDKIPNSINSLKFDLINGDIKIKTESIDNPTLKVYTHNRAEENELENRFNINFESDYLYISEISEREHFEVKNMSIHNYSTHYLLELTLPSKEYDLFTATTLNGDIDINGIKLENLNLKTQNGDIDIEDISAKSLIAATSNGDINISDTDVDAINTLTSRGDICVEDFRTDNLVCKSSMGDIDISDSRDIGESLNCNTSMGDIDVDLTGVAADIELDASVSAPMGDLNLSDRFLLVEGSKRKRKVYTNTNFKRNIYVHLNTSFGDINVD